MNLSIDGSILAAAFASGKIISLNEKPKILKYKLKLFILNYLKKVFFDFFNEFRKIY